MVMECRAALVPRFCSSQLRRRKCLLARTKEDEFPAWASGPLLPCQAWPPPTVKSPGSRGALPRADLVAVVCEEGHMGGWGAVALLLWPCQLPVLAVVEHLTPGSPVWPPPPPLGVRVHCSHIRIPARSFTAAKTRKVVSVRKEESLELGQGLIRITKDTTRASSGRKANGNTYRLDLNRKTNPREYWQTPELSLSQAWAWDNGEAQLHPTKPTSLPVLARSASTWFNGLSAWVSSFLPFPASLISSPSRSPVLSTLQYIPALLSMLCPCLRVRGPSLHIPHGSSSSSFSHSCLPVGQSSENLQV